MSFFDPRPRPLLDDGEKDQTAARNGKPLEMQDEYPKRLYHRTNRESAMAIVEQGFLVGGGPEVESGKAHVYFSDKPLEDIAYKSGVRASAKFELVVDTEIAMYAILQDGKRWGSHHGPCASSCSTWNPRYHNG